MRYDVKDELNFLDENENKHQTISLKKMKSKLIISSIIVLLISIIALMIYFNGYENATQKLEQRIEELENENKKLSKQLSDQIAVYEKASKEINISVVNQKIQSIGELATIEYLYTDAAKFSDTKKISEFKVPLTTKSFITKWNGSIKAGVKVDKITTEINHLKKEIIIHIPKAEILSHEIDDKSFEILDEKNGLFNPIEITDIRNFDSSNKEFMEKKAIEIGILDKALENATNIISNLINTDIVKEQNYTITFKTIEE